MAQSNLKAVSNDRPQQLSHTEMQSFAADLMNDVCNDETVVDRLLMVAVHLMEHCHDWNYLDNLGTALAQQLYGATSSWSGVVLAHAEAVRRKVVGDEKAE